MACSLPPDPSINTRMAPQNYLRHGPGVGHVFNTARPFLTNPGPNSSPVQPEPALSDSPSTTRLSVVVITRDEERNLPRLLDSVQDVADEIVVFDSGSTDATVALAEAAGRGSCPALGRVVGHKE